MCLGAEACEEFKVIFHIFMFCLGLKVKNSLLVFHTELKQLRAKMCLQLLLCILISSPRQPTIN